MSVVGCGLSQVDGTFEVGYFLLDPEGVELLVTPGEEELPAPILSGTKPGDYRSSEFSALVWDQVLEIDLDYQRNGDGLKNSLWSSTSWENGVSKFKV